MDKRQIKQLVKASITNNTIDQEKVERIVALLTRSELKLYIHGLKNWIRQHTVVIEVPRGTSAISDTLKKQFEGKAAIVTGATRGIGKAIARELAQLGCSVAFNYS